jgi:hypothetical protein
VFFCFLTDILAGNTVYEEFACVFVCFLTDIMARNTYVVLLGI